MCVRSFYPFEDFLEGALLAVEEDAGAVDACRNPDASQSCGIEQHNAQQQLPPGHIERQAHHHDDG